MRGQEEKCKYEYRRSGMLAMEGYQLWKLLIDLWEINC